MRDKIPPAGLLGIGEMASRRALDAKFEVRILDPQPEKAPVINRSFFVKGRVIINTD